jgi:hypothetical protein
MALGFDYLEWLRNADPLCYYTLEHAPPYNNKSVQAIKSSDSSGGRWPEHHSLILKHAPPESPNLGRNFGRERQVIIV